MNYTVYKHIFPNNKVYIGITRKRPEDRWGCQGYHYHTNMLMWQDIKKYGWDNIEHIILYENKSREEASELERKLIKEHKANQIEYGYNIQVGGIYGASSYFDEEKVVQLFKKGLGLQNISNEIGCCTRTASEILRRQGVASNEIIHQGHIICGEKIRISKEEKERILLLFKEGKNISDIAKETHISRTVIKNTLCENNITEEDIKNNYYFFSSKDIPVISELIENGKTITEISRIFDCSYPTVSLFIKTYLPYLKNKIQENKITQTIKNTTKKVKQYDLNGKYIKTFDSLSSAEREVSDKEQNGSSHIVQCCKKTRQTAYGYIWRYEEDEEDIILPSSKAKSKVIQYDMNNNFVKEFNTIKEAAEAVNVSHSCISAVCRGIKKTAGGYKWAYADKNYEKRPRMRKVSQYTLDNKFIQTFSSIQEASNKTGVGYDSISATCRNKQKTGGGFIWRYALENND